MRISCVLGPFSEMQQFVTERDTRGTRAQYSIRMCIKSACATTIHGDVKLDSFTAILLVNWYF